MGRSQILADLKEFGLDPTKHHQVDKTRLKRKEGVVPQEILLTSETSDCVDTVTKIDEIVPVTVPLEPEVEVTVIPVMTEVLPEPEVVIDGLRLDEIKVEEIVSSEIPNHVDVGDPPVDRPPEEITQEPEPKTLPKSKPNSKQKVKVKGK